MIRTIHLHGKLRDLVGRDAIPLDAATVAEAISGLCSVTGRALHPIPGQGRHCIAVAGFDTEESLRAPLSDKVTELHLVPSFAGGKQGGVVQIVIGAVLIAATVYSGGATAALAGSTSWGAAAFWAGASLTIGGALAMFSPAPKQDLGGYAVDSNPDASKYLGAPRNTVKLGTRIPILYGEGQLYGHILSVNIDAKDVAV